MITEYTTGELIDFFDRALRYEYGFIKRVTNATIKFSPYTSTPTYKIYLTCYIKPHKKYEFEFREYLYKCSTFLGIGEGLLFDFEYN